MNNSVSPKKNIRGVFQTPADKSISQRAVILGALADGETYAENVLESADVLSAVDCVRALGAKIEKKCPGTYKISGRGLRGLAEPSDVLNAGNSGTAFRLISGILAGRDFYSVMTGDESLRSRPMGRIIEPLKLMGARISARGNNRFAPVTFMGGRLRGIEYSLPVASAQVKSCLLLAGLCGDGETILHEPVKSRDHTENMLKSCGADIEVDQLTVKIRGGSELSPFNIRVPGDFSSAAFLMAAALIAPESEICIESVGLNPTRTGFLEAIKMMGARISVENVKEDMCGEKIGDVTVKHSALKGIELDESLVPSMIDELPLIAVLGAYADGKTLVKGASELRVKECDRIKVMAENMGAMGAVFEETDDGFMVEGGRSLKGAVINPRNDHRMAMAMAVAALGADSPVIIEESRIVDVSFPGFWQLDPFRC